MSISLEEEYAKKWFTKRYINIRKANTPKMKECTAGYPEESAERSPLSCYWAPLSPRQNEAFLTLICHPPHLYYNKTTLIIVPCFTIFALLTFTATCTLNSAIKAFAIFFQTVWFFTITISLSILRINIAPNSPFYHLPLILTACAFAHFPTFPG